MHKVWICSKLLHICNGKWCENLNITSTTDVSLDTLLGYSTRVLQFKALQLNLNTVLFVKSENQIQYFAANDPMKILYLSIESEIIWGF